MDAHLWLAAEIAVEEAHNPGRVIDQVQLPLWDPRHDNAREPPRPRPNLAYHRIWTNVLKRRGREQWLGRMCVVAASGPLPESQGFTDARVRAMPSTLWTEPRLALVALAAKAGGPSDPRLASAVILVGGLLVATAGYLAGLAALIRGQTVAAVAWVSGLGIVFHITLWLMPGLLRGEIIRYALSGRLGGVYRLNPYCSPP